MRRCRAAREPGLSSEREILSSRNTTRTSRTPLRSIDIPEQHLIKRCTLDSMLVRALFTPATRTKQSENGSTRHRHPQVCTGPAIEPIARAMVSDIESQYDDLLDFAKHDAARQDEKMPFSESDALLELILWDARDENKLTLRESGAWRGNVRHELRSRTSVNLDHVLVVLQFIREEYHELYKTVKTEYPEMLAHKNHNLSADKKCEKGLTLAEQANLMSAAVKQILVLGVSPIHPRRSALAEHPPIPFLL